MATMLVWRYYHRLVLAAIILVVDALDFHPLLSQGEPGAPGIKSRILANGLRYLNRVAANIVADQLPKLRSVYSLRDPETLMDIILFFKFPSFSYYPYIFFISDKAFEEPASQIREHPGSLYILTQLI